MIQSTQSQCQYALFQFTDQHASCDAFQYWNGPFWHENAQGLRRFLEEWLVVDPACMEPLMDVRTTVVIVGDKRVEHHYFEHAQSVKRARGSSR